MIRIYNPRSQGGGPRAAQGEVVTQERIEKQFRQALQANSIASKLGLAPEPRPPAKAALARLVQALTVCRFKLGQRNPICKSGGSLAQIGSDAGWGFAVGFAMTPGGLLVHSCDEWPCAVCRPSQISESRAYCLCLNCAYGIMAAASAGELGARALLDEISDALSLLEAQQPEPRMPAN